MPSITASQHTLTPLNIVVAAQKGTKRKQKNSGWTNSVPRSDGNGKIRKVSVKKHKVKVGMSSLRDESKSIGLPSLCRSSLSAIPCLTVFLFFSIMQHRWRSFYAHRREKWRWFSLPPLLRFSFRRRSCHSQLSRRLRLEAAVSLPNVAHPRRSEREHALQKQFFFRAR